MIDLPAGLTFVAEAILHCSTRPVAHAQVEVVAGRRHDVMLDGVRWQLLLEVAPRTHGLALILRGGPLDRPVANAAIALRIASPWSADAYLGMPGAAYGGNRFISRPIDYPPLLQDPADIGPDVPPIMTDVPRLELGTGQSRIQLLARDCTLPAIGWIPPGSAHGWWLASGYRAASGGGEHEIGLEAEENAARDQLTVRIQAPGVREGMRYFITTMRRTPSTDRGTDLEPGQEIELACRLLPSPGHTPNALWHGLLPLRAEAARTERSEVLPFSAAGALVAEHQDRDYWDESAHAYGCGRHDDAGHMMWQPGWVGGLQNTLPLLQLGNAQQRARSRQTLDFAFGPAQLPSGLFQGVFEHGGWHGDGFGHAHAVDWLHVRKSGDLLYVALKHFTLLEQQAPGQRLPQSWLAGARRCADALVDLWRRHGQFGQFVDGRTLEVRVGGSTAGGIIPGALILAWERWQDPIYRAAAEAGARHLVSTTLDHGWTLGGPGEILQAPDSESCFGLLESLVMLHAVTRDPAWLVPARDCAAQAASWVVAGDYPFPWHSHLGRIAARSTGTVWASVQNKHAAPGICTASGDSLLRLWRATGETQWLTLLQEIAHSLMQYVSRPAQPIGGMASGWVNERVNTSDWLEPVGDIFNGPCWSSVSVLMTAADLPSIYVDRTRGTLTVLDHISATLGSEGRLEVHNPTAFAAEISVMAEDDAERRRPLTVRMILDLPRVVVPAGGRVTYALAAGMPMLQSTAAGD